MDWAAQVDGYCERVGPGLWAEPVNAVTNAAFVLVALWLWRRHGAAPVRVLTAILAAIGVGSLLFHTFATRWAGLMDVVPIGLFILTYIYLVNRAALGLPGWAALIGTGLFVPYAALLVPVLDAVPFLRISDFYWTVPILLVVYALGLRGKPQIARGFVTGAAILSLSICLRSVDEMLCDALPIGTHFLWHLLNAAMLGYMINLYGTHILAARRAGR